MKLLKDVQITHRMANNDKEQKTEETSRKQIKWHTYTSEKKEIGGDFKNTIQLYTLYKKLISHRII